MSQSESEKKRKKSLEFGGERLRGYWDAVYSSHSIGCNSHTKSSRKDEEDEQTGRILKDGDSLPQDWLLPFPAFQEAFMRHAGLLEEGNIMHMKVLVVGNGISLVPQELAALGFGHVTATDISDVATQHMATTNPFPDKVRFVTCDMFDMRSAIPDNAFDIILDKATLDGVLFRQPAELREPLAAKALSEYHRVLRKGSGRLVIVTPRRRICSSLPGIQSWTRLPVTTLYPQTGSDVTLIAGPSTNSRQSIYVFGFINFED